VARHRRIMYNRASADAPRQAWDPSRPASRGTGRSGWATSLTSRPTRHRASTAPSSCFRRASDASTRRAERRPVPEHYEAVEAAVENPLHPKVTSSRSSRSSDRQDVYGNRDQFPWSAATYRLTEMYLLDATTPAS